MPCNLLAAPSLPFWCTQLLLTSCKGRAVALPPHLRCCGQWVVHRDHTVGCQATHDLIEGDGGGRGGKAELMSTNEEQEGSIRERQGHSQQQEPLRRVCCVLCCVKLCDRSLPFVPPSFSSAAHLSTLTHLLPCVARCCCARLHLLHQHIQLCGCCVLLHNHCALSTSLQLALAAC